jgi:hypothetical protein
MEYIPLLSTLKNYYLIKKMNLDTERERLFTVSDFGSLKIELNTDQAKNFWINIYNAYYQIEARKSTNRKTIF